MTEMRSVRRWWGAGLASAAVVLACAAPAPAAQAAPMPAAATLTWRPCTDPAFDRWEQVDGGIAPGFECAWLTRPLDRSNPSGAKVHLAVVRLPASGTPEQRKGVLVWNPGGPGQTGVGLSGVAYLLPPSVRQAFDFVTWDPRGIGASLPAISGRGCSIPKPTRPATGGVNWNLLFAARSRQVARMNAQCYAGNAAIIDHAGTVDNAYDLDALRAALGEQRINYWGLSYGTLIGSTYFQLFPNRVRAAVQDASMDPQTSMRGISSSAVAPDHSFGFFLQANPNVARRYALVINALNRRTIALPNRHVYTRWDLLDVLNDSVMFYADPSGNWTVAEQVIGNAYHALFSSGLVRSRALVALQSASMQSPSSGTVGGLWSAVVCQDFTDRMTEAQQRAQLQWIVRNAPWYGGTLGMDMVMTCNGYEAARPHPVPIPRAYGPNVPIMVAGSTRDGENPYQWSVNMARVYRNSRMVTLVGGLHGTFGLGESKCVNVALGNFLVTRDFPPVDVTCSWTPPYPAP